MKDILIPLVGTVDIKVYEKGLLVKEYHKKNNLTVNAKNIVTKCLGGSPHHIDQIVVLTGLVVTATSPSVVATYGTGTVTFTALFNETSFVGTFDELNLKVSYDSTVFSILQGLAIAKTITQKIAISWKLTYP